MHEKNYVCQGCSLLLPCKLKVLEKTEGSFDEPDTCPQGLGQAEWVEDYEVDNVEKLHQQITELRSENYNMQQRLRITPKN